MSLGTFKSYPLKKTLGKEIVSMRLLPLGVGSSNQVSEAALERRLARAVKKAGGLIIKLPALWYIGIPDRMILLSGPTIYFVELKRNKKKASVRQKKWIIRLRQLGF